MHGLDIARSTPTCWKSTRQISTNSLQRSIKQRTSTNTKLPRSFCLSFFLSFCSCILCIQLSTVMATDVHSRLYYAKGISISWLRLPACSPMRNRYFVSQTDLAQSYIQYSNSKQVTSFAKPKSSSSAMSRRARVP